MKQTTIILLTIYVLLLTHTSFSQPTDSLVSGQSQSQSDIIGNVRTILIDAFVQNDKQRVQELHRYLSENFDQDNYLTLFPAEKILLFAWSGDFKSMLYHIKEVDSIYIARMQTKITPISTNNFYKTLKNRVQQESDVIFSNLQSSFLTQEEKDFATIYLHYYLITDENYNTTVPIINTITRKFIKTYPNSEYIKLLDSYELKLSNWGWGYAMNFGYSAKTGDFSKYFHKNDGVMDLSIDATYKRVMANMGFSVAFGKVQEDIILSNDLVLPKNISASQINFYLSFGYRFFDNKRFILTPIAGIGCAWINPGSESERKENPSLEQFNYSYGLTTNIGIMTDIRFGRITRVPGQNFFYPSFFAMRLSYKFFHHNLKETPIHYNGNLHTITAGFSLYGKRIKSVKYK